MAAWPSLVSAAAGIDLAYEMDTRGRLGSSSLRSTWAMSVSFIW